MLARPLFLAPGLALTVAACATNVARQGFEEDPASSETAETIPSTEPSTDFGEQAPPPKPEEIEINEVYGHSATTLYKLEPKTKAVTVVGDFKGCERITDIALDEKSAMYGVSFDVLYVIDKSTATCSEIKRGSYPNSLSFVPKGVLDPDAEVLVGYDGSDYLRVDVSTGKTSVIGKLGTKFGSNLVSSGDIVSVKGGQTYLTVKGGSCSASDCLVEVDPKTGGIVKNWGSVEHKNVFGLSFWGGKVYGFDDQGGLFEVTFGTSQLATQGIAIPGKPSDLSFWGAGSSTSAPLESGPQ